MFTNTTNMLSDFTSRISGVWQYAGNLIFGGSSPEETFIKKLKEKGNALVFINQGSNQSGIITFELMEKVDGGIALTIVNEQGQARVISRNWEKPLGNYFRRISAKIENIEYGDVTKKWQAGEFERFQNKYCKMTENSQNGLDYFDEEIEKTVTFCGKYSDLKLKAYLHWTHLDGMPDEYKDQTEAENSHTLRNVLIGALAVSGTFWGGRLVKEKAQQALNKVSFADGCLDGLALATVGSFLSHGINPTVLGFSAMMCASRVEAPFPPVINLSSLDGKIGFKIDGEEEEDASGLSVSKAGDINGDGIDDVVIAAPGANYDGISYVIFGHNGTWISPLQLSSLDGSNGFKIACWCQGIRVSNAGDVNGDGVDDLIIGVSCTSTSPGYSYIIFGHIDPWAASPLQITEVNGSNGFSMEGEALGDSFGCSVSSAGDVNGDNIADLIVGAYHANPSGRTDAGRSYVIFGHTGNWTSPLQLSGLNGNNGFKVDGEAVTDGSGALVSGAGDLNGDGIGDLIIAAPRSKRAYLIFGHNGTWISPLQLSSLNGSNGIKLIGEPGTINSISDAGDINGDGFGDVILANYYYSKSYVVFGHSGPWTSELQLTDLDGNNGFQLNGIPCEAVNSAGDINGDGIGDLVIGAGGIDRSYVVFGHIDPWVNSLNLTNLDGSNGFQLNGIYDSNCGEFISSAGDVNGDGPDDLIIGAYGANPSGKYLAGQSYVVFGTIAPVLVNNQLTIKEGQTVVFNSTYLSAIDENQVDGTLIFIVSDIQHGQFELLDNSGIAITSFSQQQIIDENIKFIHDDEEDAPSYEVSVSDGCATIIPLPAFINFINVNDAPTVNAYLNLKDCGIISFTLSQLNVTDSDSESTSFIYYVQNVQHGQFELDNSGIAISTFTQNDIVASAITFVHACDNEAPSYEIIVNDRDDNSTANIAVVNFNYRPVIINNKLSIAKGESKLITTEDLTATDKEGDDANLLFNIFDVSNGFFWNIDAGPAITAFPQHRITANKIYFTHDGTDYAPYYTVSATDSVLESSLVPVNVTCTNFPCLIKGSQLSSTLSLTETSFSNVYESSSQTLSSAISEPMLLSSQKPSSSTVNETKGSSAVSIVLGILFPLLVISCGIGGVAFWWYRRTHFHLREISLTNIISMFRKDEHHEINLEMSLPFWTIREIGHGGYAMVYEGKYKKPGSKQEIDVAIKKLHRTYVESDGLESIKEEFAKEAAFLQQYKHPNLIEIIDFIPDPHWCIILKYYHRGSLANVLRDQKYPLPWNPERNGFMTGIAQGLKFLHANNIIHRDMKPDNVLIDENMQPKITDFGTARIQDTLTQTKGVGTPTYIAPEVVRPITGDSKVHYDSAVDVYALGLILWAIWKREEPFQEFENAWQMMTCVIDEQGRPPLDGCPSPSLASLMSRCWAHRADVRPRMPQVCDELNTVTTELAFA